MNILQCCNPSFALVLNNIHRMIGALNEIVIVLQSKIGFRFNINPTYKIRCFRNHNFAFSFFRQCLQIFWVKNSDAQRSRRNNSHTFHRGKHYLAKEKLNPRSNFKSLCLRCFRQHHDKLIS